MKNAWRFLLFTATASLLVAGNAHAVVLNWSNVTWTPGSLSNSYDVDGFTSNGNDLTVAISGNTNKLTVDPVTGIAAPNISNSLAGRLRRGSFALPRR